jgi:hypothetical protein
MTEALGPGVASLVRDVPDPVTAAERLVEALVTIDEPPALIALAERLDHARHLHMRQRVEWRPYFEQTVAVYLPVAARLSPELSRRFERWAAAFEQRLN